MDFEWLTNPEQPSTATKAQRRWARRVLDVQEDAPREQSCQTLIGRLEEHGFLPPAQWRDAAWILEDEALGIGGDIPDQFEADEQGELARHIAGFAGEFFHLDPRTRQSRWRALLQEVTAGPLAAWLGLLKPGLGIEAASTHFDSPVSCAILAAIQELFVLLPHERARRRRKLVRELAFSDQEIEEALKELRTQHPQWLDLGRDFVTALAHVRFHGSGSFSMIARGYQAELPPGTSKVCTRQYVGGSVLPHEQQTAAGRNSSDQRMWLFIVPVVVIVLRVVMSAGGNATRTSTPYGVPQQSSETSKYAQEVLQFIHDRDRGKIPPIVLPLNDQGKLVIRPPKESASSDETREALRRVLGMPTDKIELGSPPQPTPNPNLRRPSDGVNSR